MKEREKKNIKKKETNKQNKKGKRGRKKEINEYKTSIV